MKLDLEPDQARAFGYRVVDRLVEHLEALPERDVVRRAGRAEMEALLREPAPEGPTAPEEVLERAISDVFGHHMPLNHPRFFGWVPGPTNFVSVMAESLVAAMNPFMGSWLVSPGPTQVELVAADWLREMVCLPATAGGLFTSGGSMANLTALATARHHRLGSDDWQRGTVYGSVETHSSVEKALRVLGFPAGTLREIETDADQRMLTGALGAAVAEDRRAGRRPFCVVANAGTTNTGAVDPIDAIAAVCREERLWLHVDGAYGAPAMLVENERAAFAGIEHADSVTLDPHKWLFQPYEIGCVLVRERAHLREAFTIFRDYMRDALGDEEEINLRDHGVQLTRSFRALKLWMSIQTFGMGAFREGVAHGLALAREAERALRARTGWEIVTPAQRALLTFRPHGADPQHTDALTERVSARMYDDGYAVMSSTRVEGRPVLRLCTINPHTRVEDIHGVVERLDAFARAERLGA